MRRPPNKENFFCVGVIATAHGIKGEITFKAFTEIPENILEYGTLVNMQDVPYSFSTLRSTKKGLICVIEGVKTRNDAEKLRGIYLYASLDMLPDAGDDNMYLDNLIGTKVHLEDETFFGTVRNHFNNGAQTIMAIKLPEEGKKDVLIPFTDDVVLNIDHQNNKMTVSEMAEDFANLEG